MVRYFLILFFTLVLSGCAGFKPYGKLGMAVQVEDQTDYYLQTDRDWNCDKNLAAIVAVGARNDKGTYCEAYHRSWWGCASLTNSDPETYYLELGCGVETDFSWFRRMEAF